MNNHSIFLSFHVLTIKLKIDIAKLQVYIINIHNPHHNSFIIIVVVSINNNINSIT